VGCVALVQAIATPPAKNVMVPATLEVAVNVADWPTTKVGMLKELMVEVTGAAVNDAACAEDSDA
jgi:hypothetical protein